MLFRKSAPHPDEVCPRCGGPKSRTMQVCTTCSLAATRAPDAPGPVPAQRAEQRATMPPPVPAFSMPPAGTASAGAPPPPGGLRAEQGVHVRTIAEKETADFLWRNRILFAYDYPLLGKTATFFLPEPSVLLLDRRAPDYESRRRELQALGHTVVPLPEQGQADRDLKAHLARHFAGKQWK